MSPVQLSSGVPGLGEDGWLPGEQPLGPQEHGRQGPSHGPSQVKATAGTGAAPAPGFRHLSGDGDVLRPGQGVGSVGPVGGQGTAAGSWRPALLCGIAGAGADGPGGLTRGPRPGAA